MNKSDNSFKVHIRTFGCQMNKYDSGIMADRLVSAGYSLTKNPGEAGVILFNSCSVREHAKNRLIGVANSMKPLKKKNPSLIIGICGCVAQEEGGKLLGKIPHADIILGTRRFPDILKVLERARSGGGPVVETGDAPEEDILPEGRIEENRAASFVAVLRGCSNFCSYCVVPFLRGPERSRPPERILKEIESLAAAGVKEVCLLGQNVLAYGRDLKPEKKFPSLLEYASKVDGIKRIRFLTSHPRDADYELISAMRDVPAVCPEIHLPVQSGSDRILSLMGRGYTRGRYLEIIGELRREIPGISVTTDIIAGFPSETEDDFKETVKLLEDVRFGDAFLYRYSPREGTGAAAMEDSVPEEAKKERLQELIKLQKRISGENNSAFLGTEAEVLVDGKSAKSPGMLFGRTPAGKNIVFPGEGAPPGSIVNVKITKTGPYTLVGEMTRPCA